jgi:hypothetical protein
VQEVREGDGHWRRDASYIRGVLATRGDCLWKQRGIAEEKKSLTFVLLSVVDYGDTLLPTCDRYSRSLIGGTKSCYRI